MIAEPGRRMLPRPRLPRPRLGVRSLVALLVVVAILGGGYLWLRGSSLVAVRTVMITGVAGPDAGEITDALRSEALTMTTLDASTAKLRRAVSAYSIVRGVTVSTHFPHRMTIVVSEQVPVAEITAGGTQTLVSANGTLLRSTRATIELPTIAVPVSPGGDQVTGAAAREVELLADAPYSFLSRIASVATMTGEGLTAQLRDGPRIVFGGASQLAAKWHAAVVVLKSSSAAGAIYIDVTDPHRPAAGSGSDVTPTTSSSTTATTGATTESPAVTSEGSGVSTSTTG